MATTLITSYVVQYASSSFRPRIWIRGEDGWIGQCIFEPNDTETLPADGAPGTSLYYRLDDFQNVLDVLRNEKPVYFAFNGPGSENAIRTSLEAVGEGE